MIGYFYSDTPIYVNIKYLNKHILYNNCFSWILISPQLGPHGQLGVSAAKSVVGVKRDEAESVTTTAQEDQAQLVT